MHTWALFSCSSLITLTAYNLSQLPNAAAPSPEPEPDASAKSASESKFSLEALSQQYPEAEAAVALPPLPDTPQMSNQLAKLDTLPADAKVYDATQYPVEEVDLVALLEQEELSFPTPDQVVTYRADAVQPLPSRLPAPPTALSPARYPQGTAIAASPQALAAPQPETLATAPTFAPSSPMVTAQVPTRPSGAPSQGTTEAQSDAAQVTTVVSATNSSQLFAALPQATIKGEAAQPTQRPEQLMADQTSGELAGTTTAAPESDTSMELTIARRQLISRYCDRVRHEANPDKRLAVCSEATSELAQRMPDAATAGTPMPGKVESPTRNNPEMGVLQFGNSPVSAAIAGP